MMKMDEGMSVGREPIPICAPPLSSDIARQQRGTRTLPPRQPIDRTVVVSSFVSRPFAVGFLAPFFSPVMSVTLLLSPRSYAVVTRFLHRGSVHSSPSVVYPFRSPRRSSSLHWCKSNAICSALLSVFWPKTFGRLTHLKLAFSFITTYQTQQSSSSLRRRMSLQTSSSSSSSSQSGGHHHIHTIDATTTPPRGAQPPSSVTVPGGTAGGGRRNPLSRVEATTPPCNTSPMTSTTMTQPTGGDEPTQKKKSPSGRRLSASSSPVNDGGEVPSGAASDHAAKDPSSYGPTRKGRGTADGSAESSATTSLPASTSASSPPRSLQPQFLPHSRTGVPPLAIDIASASQHVAVLPSTTTPCPPTHRGTVVREGGPSSASMEVAAESSSMVASVPLTHSGRLHKAHSSHGSGFQVAGGTPAGLHYGSSSASFEGAHPSSVSLMMPMTPLGLGGSQNTAAAAAAGSAGAVAGIPWAPQVAASPTRSDHSESSNSEQSPAQLNGGSPSRVRLLPRDDPRRGLAKVLAATTTVVVDVRRRHPAAGSQPPVGRSLWGNTVLQDRHDDSAAAPPTAQDVSDDADEMERDEDRDDVYRTTASEGRRERVKGDAATTAAIGLPPRTSNDGSDDTTAVFDLGDGYVLVRRPMRHDRARKIKAIRILNILVALLAAAAYMFFDTFYDIFTNQLTSPDRVGSYKILATWTPAGPPVTRSMVTYTTSHMNIGLTDALPSGVVVPASPVLAALEPRGPPSLAFVTGSPVWVNAATGTARSGRRSAVLAFAACAASSIPSRQLVTLARREKDDALLNDFQRTYSMSASMASISLSDHRSYSATLWCMINETTVAAASVADGQRFFVADLPTPNGVGGTSAARSASSTTTPPIILDVVAEFTSSTAAPTFFLCLSHAIFGTWLASCDGASTPRGSGVANLTAVAAGGCRVVGRLEVRRSAWCHVTPATDSPPVSAAPSIAAVTVALLSLDTSWFTLSSAGQIASLGNAAPAPVVLSRNLSWYAVSPVLGTSSTTSRTDIPALWWRPTPRRVVPSVVRFLPSRGTFWLAAALLFPTTTMAQMYDIYLLEQRVVSTAEASSSAGVYIAALFDTFRTTLHASPVPYIQAPSTAVSSLPSAAYPFLSPRTAPDEYKQLQEFRLAGFLEASSSDTTMLQFIIVVGVQFFTVPFSLLDLPTTTTFSSASEFTTSLNVPTLPSTVTATHPAWSMSHASSVSTHVLMGVMATACPSAFSGTTVGRDVFASESDIPRPAEVEEAALSSALRSATNVTTTPMLTATLRAASHAAAYAQIDDASVAVVASIEDVSWTPRLVDGRGAVGHIALIIRVVELLPPSWRRLSPSDAVESLPTVCFARRVLRLDLQPPFVNGRPSTQSSVTAASPSGGTSKAKSLLSGSLSRAKQSLVGTDPELPRVFRWDVNVHSTWLQLPTSAEVGMQTVALAEQERSVVSAVLRGGDQASSPAAPLYVPTAAPRVMTAALDGTLTVMCSGGGGGGGSSSASSSGSGTSKQPLLLQQTTVASFAEDEAWVYAGRAVSASTGAGEVQVSLTG